MSTVAATASRKSVTLHRLREMQAQGEKISMLTSYDATFARLADECGVDCLLVGDSLGMVVQGESSTVPVSMADMVYHTQCVAKGNRTAWVVGDLPFGSYQEGREQALRSSVALMQAGAHMVKLEGGGWTADTVHFLTERGIPVCAHLGLTPQSVHALGGYRIQGRDQAGAETMRRHARELAQAGAAMMVLELMPSAVATQVQSDNPGLITIGIGAGAACDGQVLLTHEMLGLFPGLGLPWGKQYADAGAFMSTAIRQYADDIHSGAFPGPENSFPMDADLLRELEG